jgi:hypothetical protein
MKRETADITLISPARGSVMRADTYASVERERENK